MGFVYSAMTPVLSERDKLIASLRPTFDFDFRTGGAAKVRSRYNHAVPAVFDTWTTSSGYMVCGADGVYTTVAANEIPLYRDPYTLVVGGVSAHRQSNSIAQPRNFAHANWTPTGVTVAAAPSDWSPLGTGQAYALTASAVASKHSVATTGAAFAAAGTRVFSVFAKASTGGQYLVGTVGTNAGGDVNRGTVVFDLVNGVVTHRASGTGAPLTWGFMIPGRNGWYQCCIESGDAFSGWPYLETAEWGISNVASLGAQNLNGVVTMPSFLGAGETILIAGALCNRRSWSYCDSSAAADLSAGFPAITDVNPFFDGAAHVGTVVLSALVPVSATGNMTVNQSGSVSATFRLASGTGYNSEQVWTPASFYDDPGQVEYGAAIDNPTLRSISGSGADIAPGKLPVNVDVGNVGLVRVGLSMNRPQGSQAIHYGVNGATVSGGTYKTMNVAESPQPAVDLAVPSGHSCVYASFTGGFAIQRVLLFAEALSAAQLAALTA